MTPEVTSNCNQAELVTALALGALSAEEVPAIKAHLAVCVACREEFDSLQPIVALLDERPSHASLPFELDANAPATNFLGDEPDWQDARPGLSYKILSEDPVQNQVSLLVRLEPGADYPAHTHAGVEELHLLDGELWIDDRKLYAGDYNRAEPGTGDSRVWSETGCTCVLITSLHDRLR
jgi:anti-sigma factor ChrR (cupin superfamily)